VPAYLINGPEELDLENVRRFSRVGITSGASTPEVLVNAVIEKLEPEDVSSMSEIDENVTFVLPKELRQDAGR
jgi:4-hydroxy-3-methylbut-2-enyl diphosphate reductase